MTNVYQNPAAAGAFSKFINSEDGRIQRDLLYRKISAYITNKNAGILDAACGQGWLAAALQTDYPGAKIEAFDSSEILINEARQKYPSINFRVADATQPLPYAEGSFNYAILNMAAHDIDNLQAAFANLNRSLKPGGTFIMTVANPYYSFPVGVWKRGLWGFLLNKKPALKVRPYHEFRRGNLFNWKDGMSSYFYPLSEYLGKAVGAGFALKAMSDLDISTDNPRFNAHYQLHRFPMILLLVFEKSSE
jgi:ubiquinone/menaquinone biosynthesis C-methylase UbiE